MFFLHIKQTNRSSGQKIFNVLILRHFNLQSKREYAILSQNYQRQKLRFFAKQGEIMENTHAKNEFMGTAPIGKLVMKVAMPVVIAQVINLLYNLVDRIYIGHMEVVGQTALTALGVCNPIIIIVSAFAALVSAGSAPKVSMALGEKDYDKAEKILGNSLTFLVFIAVVLTVALLIFQEPLLYLFGASDNTIGFAMDYLAIYALGTVFVQIALGMNTFITAQGFALFSMLTISIGAVCNIILDPIFIFALNMGVKGAALATIISQAVSAVWVLLFLSGKRTGVKIRLKNLRPDFKVILPCLALGVSPFIMQASESIIMICFNRSLLKYGGDVAVGALTVMSSVMQMTIIPLSGFCSGAQPVAAYNYGAKNVQRVKKTFSIMLIVSVVYSAIVWGLVMLFPETVVKIFNNEESLVSFAGSMLRVYMAVSLLMGIQLACQLTFIAIDCPLESFAVAVVRKFILLLPLIYILPLLFEDKVFAVYLAEPVADFIAITFTVILFAIRFNKKMGKLEKEVKKANNTL